MRLKKYCVTLLSCTALITASSLKAQDTSSDYNNDIIKTRFSSEPVIITGQRYESSVLKEGKTVTVITEEEIRNSGKDDLTQVLDTIPGITVNREGTDCGTANIFIRGSKSGNVLILIDGVKINDPAGTGKTVDLSLIKTDNIERIEIVEGAMSSLYGSDASGGVINIITKRSHGDTMILKFNGGMYDSFSQSVMLSKIMEKGSFLFSGAHYSSGGISAAKDATGAGNFDDDSIEQYTASCKMKGELWDRTSLMFNMTYSGKEMDIDAYAGSDDPDSRSSNRLFTTSGEFRHSPFAWWNYRTGVSFMSLDRVYNNPDASIMNQSASTFQSSGMQGTFLNNFILPVIGTLSVGAEIMNEQANISSACYDFGSSATVISFIQDRSVTTSSLFIHEAYSLSDIFFMNAGIRLDNHTEFGNHFTWDAAAAFLIPVIKTKIRSSIGSAYKSPSLYELYDSEYGNPDLKPEKSFVYDAGIYQVINFNDNSLSFEATYFYQRFTDMLSFDPVTYDSINVDGEMANRGIEAGSSLKIGEILSLRYAYTFLDFISSTDGKRFLKRPGHKHAVVMQINPVTGLGINLSYLYTGSRYGTETIKLEPYHKVDANIRYEFSGMLTITLRGENLTDADYEDTYGYNTYGRSFSGGVELTF